MAYFGGEDAKVLDTMVRQEPEQAYEMSFLQKLNQQGHMGLARNDEQTEE